MQHVIESSQQPLKVGAVSVRVFERRKLRLKEKLARWTSWSREYFQQLQFQLSVPCSLWLISKGLPSRGIVPKPMGLSDAPAGPARDKSPWEGLSPVTGTVRPPLVAGHRAGLAL